ncbi:Monooxygenase, FAD-binding protein [Corchorus capsularis]|uniref:Monooxygenase, FAD-binding protein n=1 Tax=Corchorus capsularis TaxID=210143 RepID=A0A1R3JIP4_COCAP|nr:Monooxygenase, FAD-binding protein [Corchorus capsularis]
MKIVEDKDIVIVGGGICGLATALALHRKGKKSMVLERSETLRATGVGIIMQPNGWRALDHLGVASKLRQTSIAVPSGHFISVDDGKRHDLSLGKGELRCLKRMDLVEALAEPLPANTVHFGCHVMSIKLDPITSYPILKLQDGSIIKAKVVIGCDGVNSIISKFLDVDAPKLFSRCATRGFTWYERGHDFGNKFHIYGKDDVQLGQLPITNNLVYWFLTRTLTSQDSGSSKKDPTFIKETSLEALKGFPEEVMEMINNSEAKSLYLTELRYHRPWEMVRAEFRRGRVAVAGDAMHTMCPFISQGGGTSLEDAVVLARCLSNANDPQNALHLYVKERRMRVFWLSLQTYLIGLTVDSTSKLKKVLGNIILFLIFGGQNSHTDYDCGRL